MRRESEMSRVLARAGWVKVRSRKHAIWNCPCGQHRLTIPNSDSEMRGRANRMADLRRTGCPSIEGLLRGGGR